MKILVNGRFRSQKITGVQRYAHEVSSRLLNKVQICEPGKLLPGWRGHLWEQTMLARLSRSTLLWSPCASGPVFAGKHVVTFHDLFALESPEWYGRAFAAWRGKVLRALARNAAHIIAISDYTKRTLVSRLNVDPSRITSIHEGVGEVFFSRSPQHVIEARHALKIPSENYFLCVGSIEPRKNLQRLVAAWKEAMPHLPPDLWLVVAGSGDPGVYRSGELNQTAPRIFFTGYVPDVYLPALYRGGRGFIYPSLGEGFGLPPLEAMASGIPVLTSSVTSLPEVCSTAATYCDPLNVLDICGAIVRLATEPGLAAALVEKGRKRAALFCWDQTARATLAVLERVAGASTDSRVPLRRKRTSPLNLESQIR